MKIRVIRNFKEYASFYKIDRNNFGKVLILDDFGISSILPDDAANLFEIIVSDQDLSQ